MTKSPLIFFGTENFSAASLEALLRDKWPIKAVVTKPDSPAGRGRKLTSPRVKQIAKTSGIRVLQPEKLTDIPKELASMDVEYGVLVAYGKIIPSSIIDLFPGGIINVHPSLLPKYRGPSPIEAVILNGDDMTGISLMKLTAGMDEGPVYFQEPIELTGQEDRLGLNKSFSKRSAELLVSKLPEIITGNLKPEPQDDSKASYCPMIKKQDGLVDLTKPAEMIEREIRAYLGYPKSQAKVNEQNIIITKARIAKDAHDGSLVMKTSPGYIEIVELTAPSGRSMSGADFLRGYGRR